ncbi:hypothetical protein AOLI_G00042860 [Acnodon oligacanthus]
MQPLVFQSEFLIHSNAAVTLETVVVALCWKMSVSAEALICAWRKTRLVEPAGATGAIIGAIIGVLLLLAIIGTVVFIIHRQRKNKSDAPPTHRPPPPMKTTMTSDRACLSHFSSGLLDSDLLMNVIHRCSCFYELGRVEGFGEIIVIFLTDKDGLLSRPMGPVASDCQRLVSVLWCCARPASSAQNMESMPMPDQLLLGTYRASIDSRHQPPTHGTPSHHFEPTTCASVGFLRVLGLPRMCLTIMSIAACVLLTWLSHSSTVVFISPSLFHFISFFLSLAISSLVSASPLTLLGKGSLCERRRGRHTGGRRLGQYGECVGKRERVAFEVDGIKGPQKARWEGMESG